jgi:hypothetical protein
VSTGELDGLAELSFVVAYGVGSDRDLAQVVGLLGVYGAGVEVNDPSNWIRQTMRLVFTVSKTLRAVIVTRLIDQSVSIRAGPTSRARHATSPWPRLGSSVARTSLRRPSTRGG